MSEHELEHMQRDVPKPLMDLWLLRYIFIFLNSESEAVVRCVCHFWRQHALYVDPGRRFNNASNASWCHRINELAMRKMCGKLWGLAGTFFTVDRNLALAACRAGVVGAVRKAIDAGVLVQRDTAYTAMENAVLSDSVPVMKMLLEETLARIGDDARSGHAIRMAMTRSNNYGGTQVLRWLMKQPGVCRVSQETGTRVLTLVAHNNYMGLRNLLTQTPECGMFVSFNMLMLAVQQGYLPVVDLLLRCTPVDPTTLNNAALHHACMRGQYAVFRRLLADERIDATVGACEVLMTAVICQRCSCVALLLDKTHPLGRDLRVDASAQNCAAAYYAAVYGYVDIFMLLLSHADVRRQLTQMVTRRSSRFRLMWSFFNKYKSGGWLRRTKGIFFAPNRCGGTRFAAETWLNYPTRDRDGETITDGRASLCDRSLTLEDQPAIHDGENRPFRHTHLNDTVYHVGYVEYHSVPLSETDFEMTMPVPDLLCAAVIGQSLQLVELLLTPELAPLVMPDACDSICLRYALDLWQHKVPIALALARDRRVNPSSDEYALVKRAISNNFVSLAEAMIGNRHVVAGVNNNVLLHAACAACVEPIVRLLLARPTVSVSAVVNRCLIDSVVHYGTTDGLAIARQLITHRTFEVTPQDTGELMRAMTTSCSDATLIERLLRHPNLKLTVDERGFDVKRIGHESVAALILNHPRTRPLITGQHALELVDTAAMNGWIDLLKSLYADPLLVLDDNALHQHVSYLVIYSRYDGFVHLLASEKFVTTTEAAAVAICEEVAATDVEFYRALRGRPRVFRVGAFVSSIQSGEISDGVLMDVLVDPAIESFVDYVALSLTLLVKGRDSMLRLLILRGKIDPSWQDNELIIRACATANVQQCAMLLLDPRVDITARDNFALKTAQALPRKIGGLMVTFINGVVRQRKYEREMAPLPFLEMPLADLTKLADSLNRAKGKCRGRVASRGNNTESSSSSSSAGSESDTDSALSSSGEMVQRLRARDKRRKRK